MKPIRQKIRILAMPIAVIAFGSLCACGMLGSRQKGMVPPAPVAPDLEKVVAIHVHAAADANPSVEGDPRPIRVCVIGVGRAGWRPPHAEERRPCTGVEKTGDVVSFESWVIPPGTSYDFRVVLPAKGGSAFLVAAEFQRGTDAAPWIDIEVARGGPAWIDVAIRGGALALLPGRSTGLGSPSAAPEHMEDR